MDVERSSLIAILPSVMISERNAICLHGSTPSDLYCRSVGMKRAGRLDWLDTSVSMPTETLELCLSGLFAETGRPAATASTATTPRVCLFPSAARIQCGPRDQSVSKDKL